MLCGRSSPPYSPTVLLMTDLWLDGLDDGIRAYVEVLSANGVETFESCQGGAGHAAPEPMVRFHGQRGAGWQALQVALDHALPVSELRRYWYMQDGEPCGPYWEMTFAAIFPKESPDA